MENKINKTIDSALLKRRILDRLEKGKQTLDQAYEEAVPERLLESRQTAETASTVTDEFYDDLKEFGLVGEEKIESLDQGVKNRLHMMIQQEIINEEKNKLRRREAARRGLER